MAKYNVAISSNAYQSNPVSWINMHLRRQFADLPNGPPCWQGRHLLIDTYRTTGSNFHALLCSFQRSLAGMPILQVGKS